MKIRFANKKDIEQLVRLFKLHAEFEKTSFNPSKKKEALLKYLFDPLNNIKCLVIEKGEEIIGYSTFMKQFSTWNATFYIYVDCLYFIQTERNNGLGTKIMNQIKEYAKSDSCQIIQWQTPISNKKAITFYQKLGAESKTKERFCWNV